MNRKRRLFLAVVVVLGAAALYQTQHAIVTRRRAEAALADLGRKAAVPEIGARVQVRESSRAPEPRAPAPRPASPDASRMVSAHPEVLALFEKAFRARFEAEYRALFDQLTLPPERVERFKQRLFQDRVDQLDLSSIRETQGADRNDPVFQALRRKQEEALRTDLQAILGPEGNEALERFRRANAVRGFVDELATGMTLTGQPMTLDQQDQLVQTIAEASARFQKGGPAMPWDANWDAIMAKAPAFLTDAQVVALRENGDQLVRFVWMLPQFYAQHRPGAK